MVLQDAEPPFSLRYRLRTATRALHETLDARVGQLDLASHDGYAAFLRLHGSIIPPLEKALAQTGAPAIVPDWTARIRSAALNADLTEMAIDADPIPAPALPRDDAFAAGALYTLEGSRLGNRYLLRQIGAPFARAFLSHGDKHLWPSFAQWLDALPLTEEQVLKAADGARFVFQLYLDAGDLAPIQVAGQ